MSTTATRRGFVCWRWAVTDGGMLFPYSDLDILFLFGNEKAEAEFRPLIGEFSRVLWDLGFRVSSAGRTIEECKRIEEDNAEFHLALLDRRFLAG